MPSCSSALWSDNSTNLVPEKAAEHAQSDMLDCICPRLHYPAAHLPGAGISSLTLQGETSKHQQETQTGTGASFTWRIYLIPRKSWSAGAVSNRQASSNICRAFSLRVSPTQAQTHFSCSTGPRIHLWSHLGRDLLPFEYLLGSPWQQHLRLHPAPQPQQSLTGPAVLTMGRAREAAAALLAAVGSKGKLPQTARAREETAPS